MRRSAILPPEAPLTKTKRRSQPSGPTAQFFAARDAPLCTISGAEPVG